MTPTIRRSGASARPVEPSPNSRHPVATKESPLTGLAVLDLSSGIVGGYCTRILADGGATVIKLEAPEGDTLRQWSASGADIADGDDGALFQYLAASKRSLVVDPDLATSPAVLEELLTQADVVIWSPGSPLTELPSLSPASLLCAHPQLTVTAITHFGLEGPWSDRAATEFTLQAWSGGVIGLGRGDPTRAPVFVGGQVGEWLSGAYAAVGTIGVTTSGAGNGQRRDRRRGHARSTGPVPDLLPRDVFRRDEPSLPVEAYGGDTRGGPGQGRHGGRRGGHGPAVAGLLRHGGSPRMGRGQDALPGAQPPRPDH